MGDSIGQTNSEWINYKTIRVVFGECGRLRDYTKVAKTTQKRDKSIKLKTLGDLSHFSKKSDMQGEEGPKVFESKKAVTLLLARIMKQNYR